MMVEKIFEYRSKLALLHIGLPIWSALLCFEYVPRLQYMLTDAGSMLCIECECYYMVHG